MGFNAARTLDDGRVVGGYARIWSVTDQGKYSTAEVSTSKKKEDGTYETDFQNKYVRLVGPAHEMAKGITEPVTVQIKNCDVTRYWSKEKEKEYINFIIFEFDFPKETFPKKAAKKVTAKEPFMEIPDEAEEEMPWET